MIPDFEAMYRADSDPWQVESSWYERRKLAMLLASLPNERYRRAWEPGCGPGLVSLALAARVDELVASDVSDTAVELARQRVRDLPGVRVLCSGLPEVPFEGTVDLVVAAEFLYYVPDLAEALDVLWSVSEPGAHLVVVHWAHHPHDAFRSGPQMHAQIRLDCVRRSMTPMLTHVDRDFLLDVYEKPR